MFELGVLFHFAWYHPSVCGRGGGATPPFFPPNLDIFRMTSKPLKIISEPHISASKLQNLRPLSPAKIFEQRISPSYRQKDLYAMWFYI